MATSKPRIRPRISALNHEKLLLAVRRGCRSQSEIVDRGLSLYFRTTEEDERDAVFLRRLDLMTRHDHRHGRDIALIQETLALFIQYFFTVMPPMAPDEAQVRAAQGAIHFQHFLDELSARIQSGGKTIKNALDDVLTTDADFFTAEELERLKGFDQEASNENTPAPGKSKAQARKKTGGAS